MTFPVGALALAVEERADVWAALGLRPVVLPVAPNYRKAMAGVQFESAEWLSEILVWTSGETELETLRLSDDRMVEKHYDLAEPRDLAVVVDELIGLLTRDTIPADAAVFPDYWAPRR
ncbi:hypothetical protein M1L60_27125 [Actinoplanes sp. TRM 88003]|uniref:Uncharacterized protein n=1 Tax=Paractinoplanes aksuensis TaxID=2939490 RepID=A0ABT1DTU3_9ACTN|nr:hypothetical protein [Actinoplanes aksuensis]MCO8274278.1 hypothetical protein [Actinoplanes aksuensis]